MARRSGPLSSASLTNLETAETLFFQFHPEALEEEIAVEWGTALPIGGSREISHYNGTRSERIPLRLFYSTIGLAQLGSAPLTAQQFTIDEPGALFLSAQTSGGPASTRTLKDAERFLKALCYGHQFQRTGTARPTARAVGVVPPPRVLFDWPNVLQIEGLVERLRVRFDRFHGTDLSPLVLIAELDLREDAARRIRGFRVRQRGSFRAEQRTLPQRFAPVRRAEPPTRRANVRLRTQAGATP